MRLEKPSRRRAAEFLAAVARSRDLHGEWVTPPSTSSELELYLQRFQQPAYISYWVISDENALAGVINVSEIVRGAFQSGYLGYYAFVPHDRRGLMTAGVAAVLRDAFGTQGLHRLEANIQPANEASRRLVQRLGFRLEGLSHRYLKIAGRWRDHERWAITVEEWRALRSTARR